MTSFTKLKCRWTSVLALRLPSKLNLILFYYYVTFRYEVKFGHLIFCMTLSTELFKTIMAWITEDLKSTDTLRLQGLKNMSMLCSKYYVTKQQRSKCKGRWLHYIYWSNCKWPDSSSTMSNKLILGVPGGNHWLIHGRIHPSLNLALLKKKIWLQFVCL